MPSSQKTSAKAARIEDDLWREAGEAAQRMDTDRSTIIREFLSWYVRRPGAELPERPGEAPKEDPRDKAMREAVSGIEKAIRQFEKATNSRRSEDARRYGRKS